LKQRQQVSFGAVIPRYGVDFAAMKAFARKAEASGYSSLWLTDHLQPPGVSGRVVETVTALAALACETRQCRLGTVVLCYSYRHPAVLASMLATIDDISGGRLEVGLGIGSRDQSKETRSLGIPHPTPRRRVEEFREYIQVLKALWTQPQAAFQPNRYPVEARGVFPCVQKPHPTLWIGARKPQMMQLAAALGDGWNYYGLTVAEYKDAARRMNDYCLNIGRDPKTLRRSFFTGIVVANSEAELAAKVARAARHRNIPERDFFQRSCTTIYGTPGQCLETVAQLAEEGVELIILRDYDASGENLTLFAEKVACKF